MEITLAPVALGGSRKKKRNHRKRPHRKHHKDQRSVTKAASKIDLQIKCQKNIQWCHNYVAEVITEGKERDFFGDEEADYTKDPVPKTYEDWVQACKDSEDSAFCVTQDRRDYENKARATHIERSIFRSGDFIPRKTFILMGAIALGVLLLLLIIFLIYYLCCNKKKSTATTVKSGPKGKGGAGAISGRSKGAGGKSNRKSMAVYKSRKSAGGKSSKKGGKK